MANTRAVKAEAQRTDISFEFDGETYRIAPPDTWADTIFEALEEERVFAAVKGMLGAAQWRTYRAKPRKYPDFLALLDAIEKAAGIEGN